jgi:2-polyprenyl-6-methoxyphenol hydroxylase-like FAD-dependent oxidoreductase
VVACDGAKSAVRNFLGIESEGEDSCKSAVSFLDFNGLDTKDLI